MVVVLGTFVVFIFSDGLVGLTQRLFIGVITAWVVLQAVRLYGLVEEPQPM